jgi:hypothetical protein
VIVSIHRDPIEVSAARNVMITLCKIEQAPRRSRATKPSASSPLIINITFPQDLIKLMWIPSFSQADLSLTGECGGYTVLLKRQS